MKYPKMNVNNVKKDTDLFNMIIKLKNNVFQYQIFKIVYNILKINNNVNNVKMDIY